MKKPMILCTKDELCQRAIDNALRKQAKKDANAKYEKTIRQVAYEKGIDNTQAQTDFEMMVSFSRAIRIVCYGIIGGTIIIAIISALTK